LTNKKIIIIGPAFPLRGGIANFNNALAKTYHQRGDDVTIFSFSLQYPAFLFPGTTQYEEGYPPRNIKIRSEINSINPFNWLSVSKKINKLQPDVVIIRYWLPFMAPCLGIISRLLNKKIKILSITDNVIPHEKRFLDKDLTNFFISSCDGFITLSKSVLNELSLFTNNANKKFLPHPIYDIYGSKISKLDALKNLELSSNNKHLLFFGFIRKYKGLDLILKAISDKRVRNLGIKLIIAGEFYDNKEYYLKMIKSLGIRDNIILHDQFINVNKVKNYFCAVDMVAQTYLSATQSGVTQIAYSFDKPMLVTNVGGLSEIVEHNKVGYVTSKDPSEIADSILDFYNNNRESFFIKNTRKAKQNFSWESFVEGVDTLIEKVRK
jgi:glycosyltransferase involved in cell wall biosynthesis